MTLTFNCPSCNAPLDTDGNEVTIRCPYCNNSVIVPEELRSNLTQPSETEGPSYQVLHAEMDLGTLVGQATQFKEVVELARQGKKIEAIKRYRQLTGLGLRESKDAIDSLTAGQSITISTSNMPSRMSVLEEQQIIVPKPLVTGTVAAGAAAAGGFSCLIWLLPVVIVLGVAIPIFFALASRGGPLSEVWQQVNPASFARLTSSFGGEGSGQGLFSDPRAVAVDGQGFIYVAEYSDGRIQRFNNAGEFQSLWNVGNKSYVGSMTANRDGTVYVVFKGAIEQFEGSTGASLGQFKTTEDHSFDYLALAPDGRLVTVINGENIMRFDRNGQPDLTIQAAISSVSGDSELDTRLAVDGLGNIYALGTFNEAVFKFAPDGKYITRFGSEGDESGQFSAPSAIAVDGQGRVYVSDMKGIQVFDSDGRYLDKIPADGFVFGMTITANNQLVAVSNRPKVYIYSLP